MTTIQLKNPLCQIRGMPFLGEEGRWSHIEQKTDELRKKRSKIADDQHVAESVRFEVLTDQQKCHDIKWKREKLRHDRNRWSQYPFLVLLQHVQ